MLSGAKITQKWFPGNIFQRTSPILSTNAPFLSVFNGHGNDQMEYMTVNDKGQFGHVRLTKQGSMDIVDNDFNHDNWAMMVRLVQNLK